MGNEEEVKRYVGKRDVGKAKEARGKESSETKGVSGSPGKVMGNGRLERT